VNDAIPGRDDVSAPETSRSVASRIAAAALIVLGVVVLLGWPFAVEEIKRLGPGMVAMNPATAVCFVLAGLSVLSLQRGASHRRTQIGRSLAGAVLLVAAAKVLSIAVGWDVGLDRWLFPSHLTDLSSGAQGNPSGHRPLDVLEVLCRG
jgi:peptidoglycan/LPS O-acetylase OafA/YrhL